MVNLCLLVAVMLVLPVSAAVDPVTVTAAISAGASVAGTTVTSMMGDGYTISSAVTVENWTKFPLVSPIVRLGEGVLSIPPDVILPAKKEAMVVRKRGSSATGTHGTASWLIEGLNRRVFIMWSIPFNYNHYNNWMAVGLSRETFTAHPDHVEAVHYRVRERHFPYPYYIDNARSAGFATVVVSDASSSTLNTNHYPFANTTVFDLMYNQFVSNDISFTSGKFEWSSNTISHSDGKVRVEGTMGTGHKASVEIVVRPESNSNYAANIRVQLQNGCQ